MESDEPVCESLSESVSPCVVVNDEWNGDDADENEKSDDGDGVYDLHGLSEDWR